MSLSTNGLSGPNDSARAGAEDSPPIAQPYRLFEPLHEGVLILDRDWQMLYANPAAAHLLPFHQDAPPQSVLWQRLPELLGTPFETELRAAAQTGEARTFRVCSAPARVRLEGRAEPTENGLCVYLQDITAQTQAGDALRAGEERFRLLYEAGRLLSETLDPETIYSRLRELIHRVMPLDGLVVSSYSPDEKLIRCEHLWTDGKRFDPSLFPPLPLTPGAGMQSEVIVSAEPRFFGDVRERVRNPRGVFYDVKGDAPGEEPQIQPVAESPGGAESALMVPILIEGRVTGVVQVMSDTKGAYSQDDLAMLTQIVAHLGVALQNARLFQGITREMAERKQREDALRQSEERLRLALDAMKGFVFDYDLATGTVFHSEGLQRMLGYHPAEITPTADWWAGLIHPDDQPFWRRQVAALHGSGGTYQIEYRVRHANGSFVDVLEQGTILRGGDGTVERVSGTTLDITAQRHAQQVISDLNVRLQRAVAETHHRVKNNLQTLSSLVEMQMPGASDQIPVTALQRIGQHIRSLATLHDFLTQGARTDASQETVSLKSALERLVPLVPSAHRSRSVSIRADEAFATLKQSASFVLLVNELVSNALKHGTGDVEVSLSLSPLEPSGGKGQERTARLEVRDNGPGFPQGFDPETAANTGLELVESLSRWDLRGETAYENLPTGGGRVVVTFPLPRLDASAP